MSSFFPSPNMGSGSFLSTGGPSGNGFGFDTSIFSNGGFPPTNQGGQTSPGSTGGIIGPDGKPVDPTQKSVVGPELLKILSQVMGPASMLLNGLMGGRGNEWQQDYLIDLLNNGRATQQFGQDLGKSAFDPLLQNLQGTQGQAGQQFWDRYPEVLDQLKQFGGQINPDQFKQSGVTDQMAQMFNQVGNSFDPLQRGGNLAGQVFEGGGWTPQYQQLFDALGPLMQGQDQRQDTLSGVGQDLLNQRGQTAQTQSMWDRAMDSLNYGGQTNPLMNAQDQANRMFGEQNFGQTPTGQTAQQLSLQTLPLLQMAGGRGAELFGRESLLPMQQAASMAKDQAGRAIKGQTEAAQRRALARGGGPGAVVGHGLANEGLADFADEGAALEADAFQKVLMGQQGLQLQQSNQGLQGLLGSTGQSADLLKGLESVGTQRQLGALGMTPQLQSNATNNMNVLGNLGLGGGQLDVSRMGQGNQMLSNYFNSQGNAANTFNSGANNQGQYSLGAGNLMGNLYGQSNQGAQGMFGGLVNSGQLGVNQSNAYTGAMDEFFKNAMAGNQYSGNMMQNTWGPQSSLANTGFNYAVGGLNSINPAGTNANPFSGWVPTWNTTVGNTTVGQGR